MTTAVTARFYRYLYLFTSTAFFFLWFYFDHHDFSWRTFLQGYGQTRFYIAWAHSIAWVGFTDTVLNYSAAHHVWFICRLGLWAALLGVLMSGVLGVSCIKN
ncbi:hypothetical protein [Microscilla marina]|uniref:Uncharacterized protein n=1 Tax=Microscilla marina ATCC 23134 TaxID=313606 RepID=A1ZH05_MICM2|nr:hypothetical protein [Microscilla marina]EAY30274.1 hypothetical protein M23134_08098 [Microscilla marina ATCC 23134]